MGVVVPTFPPKISFQMSQLRSVWLESWSRKYLVLVFLCACLVGDGKVGGWKTFCLVEEKNGGINNIVYING